MLGFNQDIKKF